MARRAQFRFSCVGATRCWALGDTGKRLAREIFGVEPPFPIAYEWIRLKGKGDMSSSRGNVLSISRMLEVVPPEVLRYLVIRERPTKTINFDPGIPLLQLVDEMDDSHSARRDPRAVALSQAGTFVAVGVPFKHLIVVAQTARFDVDRAVEILHRTGYADVQREAVAGRIEYARRWLESFAPEELKFEVQESVPQQASELSDEQRAFLRRLAGQLDAPRWGPSGLAKAPWGRADPKMRFAPGVGRGKEKSQYGEC